ncbi:MAG TPA: DUF1345 domain-containing protein [Dongiaceae bacterium]|nr:DUF1345 domain-containing protein [Dongiaceae bacterium]
MNGLRHIRHHGRFYVAALAGLALWLAAWLLHWPLPPLIGGDVFFLIYLALMVRFALQITPDGLRRRAGIEDEGMPLIVLLALGAVVLSLASIFALLARSGDPDPWELSLAIGSVPLGWATVHTIAAFHYAHLFYAGNDAETCSDEGLVFPDTAEPGAWDFLYFSFVIGMTAQVSDVTVRAGGMRKLVLGHSILSFFYNTVLLALAVNVAVTFAR